MSAFEIFSFILDFRYRDKKAGHFSLLHFIEMHNILNQKGRGDDHLINLRTLWFMRIIGEKVNIIKA